MTGGREHLTWVDVGVTFGSDAEYCSLEEDQENEEENGEYQMQENGGYAHHALIIV
jgi:hypothetical protein